MDTKSASILLEQAIQILSDTPSQDDAALARDALVSFRDGWFAQHRTRAHREPQVPRVPQLEFQRWFNVSNEDD